jgi:hypothetical protein
MNINRMYFQYSTMLIHDNQFIDLEAGVSSSGDEDKEHSSNEEGITLLFSYVQLMSNPLL